MKLFYDTFPDKQGFCLLLEELTGPHNNWMVEKGSTLSNELTVSIGSPMENELKGIFLKADKIICKAL